MQTAHNGALCAPAILSLLPIPAQFKFNRFRRDTMIFAQARAPLVRSGHLGNWRLIYSRTGTAGRIHCEGSTK